MAEVLYTPDGKPVTQENPLPVKMADGVGGGDMLKETYDTNDNGKVDIAETADSVAWSGISGKPSTYPPETHDHDESYAPINHNHDGTYAPVSHAHATGVTAIETPTEATVEDVATKINEILAALQG